MSVPVEPGERIMFVDQRDRTYLVTLVAGGTFHTHGGQLAHDLVIGRDEGARVATSGGMVLIAFRPRFADVVLRMPRSAQVVGPEALAHDLVYAAVAPGA